MNLVALPPPARTDRPFAAIVVEASIIAGEIVTDRLVEFEFLPSPLARELELARDR